MRDKKAKTIFIRDGLMPPRMRQRDRFPLLYAQAEVLLPVAFACGLAWGVAGFVVVTVVGACSIALQVGLWGLR